MPLCVRARVCMCVCLYMYVCVWGVYICAHIVCVCCVEQLILCQTLGTHVFVFICCKLADIINCRS